MVYYLDGKEYDQIDIEDMDDDELGLLQLEAEKFARDQDLIITRGKSEYERNGRNPAYGLSSEEFARRKNAKADALGLISAIKLEIAYRKDEQ